MTIGMEHAWLLPALSFAAFAVLALASLTGVAERLPGGGAWLAILAVVAASLLFWPIAADELARGPHSFTNPWAQTAGVDLQWG